MNIFTACGRKLFILKPRRVSVHGSYSDRQRQMILHKTKSLLPLVLCGTLCTLFLEYCADFSSVVSSQFEYGRFHSFFFFFAELHLCRALAPIFDCKNINIKHCTFSYIVYCGIYCNRFNSRSFFHNAVVSPPLLRVRSLIFCKSASGVPVVWGSLSHWHGQWTSDSTWSILNTHIQKGRGVTVSWWES